MWERFSFYGMKAFLVLFAADSARGGLGWSEASASRLMGTYGFMAYGLPVLGGFLADRFLGTHRALVIGACIIAAGHFMLAVPAVPTFFVGLALVAIGTGFFKVNASTMVGTALSAGRQATRRRLHHLLHGRQRRRVPGPDRVRLPRREPALGLALGLRSGGRRHVARARDVPGAAAQISRGHRRRAEPHRGRRRAAAHARR